MAKKTKGPPYYRFIRINGALQRSPDFNTKDDANTWYEGMKRNKKFNKFGLVAPVRQSDVPLFEDKFAEFFDDREANYGKNTTAGEDRNARIHILPTLGSLPLNQVTHQKIERLLKTIMVTKQIGGKEVKIKASPSTKAKVKALISAFFEYLLKEDPPVVSINPVRLLPKQSGQREHTGPKLPKNLLRDDADVLKFLDAAKSIGTHKFAGHCAAHEEVKGRAFMYATIMCFLGPRVEEVIGLRWRDIDFKGKTVTFAWVYEREAKQLIKKTKKGMDTERMVPLPEALASVFQWFKSLTPYNKPTDFILSKPGGGHMTYSTVRQMHERICKYAGVTVSRHGLRHSFGRLFAKRSGNMKALQEILGHASMATTEIYSKLDADHLQEFSDSMAVSAKLELPKFKKNGV